MRNENRFCLYFHFTKNTHQVFYVGIGTGYRPKRFSGRNEMWERIVKKHGFYSQIIFKDLTWDKACEFEIKYIKMIGRRSLKQGPLVNFTDGGDGTPGCTWNLGSKRTPEQKKRISDALKGRKVDPKALANSVAAKKKNRDERIKQGIKKPKRVLSENEIQRIRTMNIGRTWSEERKKSHSDKMKGRKRPPEVVEALRQRLKGVPKSEEHKRRVSEGVKKQWAEKRTWYYKS
jgi:hypothetical protein